MRLLQLMERFSSSSDYILCIVTQSLYVGFLGQVYAEFGGELFIYLLKLQVYWLVAAVCSCLPWHNTLSQLKYLWIENLAFALHLKYHKPYVIREQCERNMPSEAKKSALSFNVCVFSHLWSL